MEEMAALGARAPLDLRVNILKATRQAAATALRDAGIAVEPTPYAHHGLRVTGTANIAALDVYKDGLVEIQDEGSQLTCVAAGVRPGELVVDLCAGGGGKTLALAAAMGGKGYIVACDVNATRLAQAEPRLARAGITNVEGRVIKPRSGESHDPDLEDLAGKADCVFVDAPCSGTGAWRRNPDARWRLTEDDLARYCAAQASVLARAARLVRTGGRLIYVTCSVLPCENALQMEAFHRDHREFTSLAWDHAWPAAAAKPAGRPLVPLLLTPARTGTDGFFAALFKREGHEQK